MDERQLLAPRTAGPEQLVARLCLFAYRLAEIVLGDFGAGPHVTDFVAHADQWLVVAELSVERRSPLGRVVVQPESPCPLALERDIAAAELTPGKPRAIELD